MEKNELKQIYFDFYDQLDEPYRSEAKENLEMQWDDGYEPEYTPFDLNDAILSGFTWGLSKQGLNYWANVLIFKTNK